jgi:uncharacterized glyoxalase superfamily protein PhnB
MQTIFPILRYRDARAAIHWLCAAFGFVERCCIPDDGPFVRHAQLQLGENIIMLGSVRPDDGIASPQASGAATQMLAVYVKDPDAHYDRANAAGRKFCIRRKIRISVLANITCSTSKVIPGRLAPIGQPWTKA